MADMADPATPRDPAPPADAFATRAVHAGAEPDELAGAVSPPIYQTSTYAQDGVGRPRAGYEYARTQNPTRERLERAVAELEGGAFGIAFASGSAATATIAELVAPGEEVIVGDDVYGGTFRFLERVARARGVDARYVDLAGDPATALAAALTPRTRLAWFETPSNPLLKVTDIAAVTTAIAGRVGAGGARPLVVVDSTFASPALQRPLQLGADVVFHSATKYLGGHSDTVGGVVVTSDAAVAERLRFLQNAIGAVPGPQDCFLVLRGLRTLALRVERHSTNALTVARALAARDDVAWLRHPGLAEGPHAHPGAAVAARQMRLGGAGGPPAFGGMVSFVPAPGGRHGRPARDRAIALAEGTRLWTLAESLGGVESLVEVPAVMTHASVAASPLEVPEALVRLSVGIEDATDLVADLLRALDDA
jgi:cystathionine beta-lyase/cystathionine gamma-synthase